MAASAPWVPECLNAWLAVRLSLAGHRQLVGRFGATHHSISPSLSGAARWYLLLVCCCWSIVMALAHSPAHHSCARQVGEDCTALLDDISRD